MVWFDLDAFLPPFSFELARIYTFIQSLGVQLKFHSTA